MGSYPFIINHFLTIRIYSCLLEAAVLKVFVLGFVVQNPPRPIRAPVLEIRLVCAPEMRVQEQIPKLSCRVISAFENLDARTYTLTEDVS